MNTVEALERKIEQVRQLGYEVHFDWFGGTGGGACQVGKRKCLFLDLAVGVIEHLAVVDDLLARYPDPVRRAA